MPFRPPRHTQTTAQPQARRDRDNLRRTLDPTRNLYKTARWRQLRDYQLRTAPMCAYCLAASPMRYTPATVCDHVRPHRGNLALFWTGPFQSLCEPCHSSQKQREENAPTFPR